MCMFVCACMRVCVCVYVNENDERHFSDCDCGLLQTYFGFRDETQDSEGHQRSNCEFSIHIHLQFYKGDKSV